MPIVAVGLSYRTAPVEIRDGVAVPPHALRSALEAFHRLPAIEEVAIISTCNRSEAYVVTDASDVACEAVVQMLCRPGNLSADLLRKHLFIYQDADAVRHLFEVAGANRFCYVKKLDRKPHHSWCGRFLSIQNTSASSNHGF